jgi:hypothetical protein
MSDRPCAGVVRGHACPHPCLDGSAFCSMHDPEAARARGRKGGPAKAARAREDRAREAAALAATIALETAEDVRALVARAVALAETSAEAPCTRANVLLRAAHEANELLKTCDLEREVAELRALVEARLGRAA